MPYRKNSDVAPEKRKGMTNRGTTIFRKTFNSAFKSKGDESSAFAIANAAVNKAGERKKKVENFAGLVQEAEADFWVIAIYDHKYPENTGYYGVSADILRKIPQEKDIIQILRLVRMGKKLSYGSDVHFPDYELSRDRQDWSSEDITDIHMWAKNELRDWRGREYGMGGVGSNEHF